MTEKIEGIFKCGVETSSESTSKECQETLITANTTAYEIAFQIPSLVDITYREISVLKLNF